MSNWPSDTHELSSGGGRNNDTPVSISNTFNKPGGWKSAVYDATKTPYVGGTAPIASKDDLWRPEKLRLDESKPWPFNKVS